MTTPCAPLSPADERFLARALQLAQNGLFTAAPNPRVGCVICRDNNILAEGWHARAGEPHAEANALAQLRQRGQSAEGADVYVTLSPCAHEGKTPSCARALAAAKPARVLAALADPNPQAAGGLQALAAAGIDARLAPPNSAAALAAARLNAGFILRVTQNRPFLRLKIAATLDGKTALSSGLSQWISGEESRADAHFLRARSCAVITGVGTALADNPRLTARHVVTTRQPLRVLVDSKLRAPQNLNLFADGGKTLVACARKPPPNYWAETVCVGAGSKTDLPALMRALAQRGINEATAETGRKLGGALLAAGLVDEIVLYVAPVAFGGGKDALSFASPPTPQDAPRFVLASAARLGDDMRLEYLRSDA